MVTTDDELKAAKEAEAIIATLSSSTHSAKETRFSRQLRGLTFQAERRSTTFATILF